VGSTSDEQLDQLYRDQHRGAVRLAYLLTGSQAVAEELAQEAFLLVADRLDGVAAPAAYLRQVVVNLTRQHHRRRDVEHRHAPTPPGPALPPEIDETWTALWQLPERQRDALVLRYYDDLPLTGVAQALGCPLGTAKSLVHRGLARLEEVLADGQP
jgi:RNA polymerase sigma factor (sigma-70 family)